MGKRAKCRRSRGAAAARACRGCLRRGGRKEFRYWLRRPSTSWGARRRFGSAWRDAWESEGIGVIEKPSPTGCAHGHTTRRAAEQHMCCSSMSRVRGAKDATCAAWRLPPRKHHQGLSRIPQRRNRSTHTSGCCSAPPRRAARPWRRAAAWRWAGRAGTLPDHPRAAPPAAPPHPARGTRAGQDLLPDIGKKQGSARTGVRHVTPGPWNLVGVQNLNVPAGTKKL